MRRMVCVLAWRAAMVFLGGAVGCAAADVQLPVVQGASGVADKVKELTGVPTRIVWAEQEPGTLPDLYSDWYTNLYLMGLCTEDGKGVRRILPEAGACSRPVLSPDGRRVLFGSRPENSIYMVDWSGANRRVVTREAYWIMEVGVDPKTGEEWVYASTNSSSTYGMADPPWDLNAALSRFSITNSGKKELVWSGRGGTYLGNVSDDGRFGASWSGGPHVYLLDFEKNQGTILRDGGCWPSMLPGLPLRFFVFNGDHRSGLVFENPLDVEKRREWRLDFGGIGVVNERKFEVYHPHWSNHERFMVATGPYNHITNQGCARWQWNGDDLKSYVPEGAEFVQVSLGRLSEDLTRVEQWVQVTQNDSPGKWMPDAWLQLPLRRAVGLGVTMAGSSNAVPRQARENRNAWPVRQDDLLFVWRGVVADNEIRGATGRGSRRCAADAKGAYWYGPYNQIMLCGGVLAPKEPLDPALLDACKRSGEFTIELVVTPAAGGSTGKVAVAAFSSGEGMPNFALIQEGSRLSLILNAAGSGQRTLVLPCTAKAYQTVHLAVSYGTGKTRVFVDGQCVMTGDEVQGDLSNWTLQPLLFGREGEKGSAWWGELEAVAFYSRALSDAEVAKNCAILSDLRRDRRSIPRAHVQAKLVAATQLPANLRGALGSYARALIVYTYEVQKVLAGTLPGDTRRILVAHWAALDWKPAEGTRFRAKERGQIVGLYLEPREAHPQLDTDLTWDDSEEPDLPLYLDVFSDGRRLQ